MKSSKLEYAGCHGGAGTCLQVMSFFGSFTEFEKLGTRMAPRSCLLELKGLGSGIRRSTLHGQQRARVPDQRGCLHCA